MKNLSAVSIFAAAIGLISCFKPITEEVVFAVEDNKNPMIVVSSPTEGSTYMSKVIVKGHVRDDSLESGDNKGSLSSLSVSASSSRSHRGRIEIESDGSYNADNDFGQISGPNFIYDSADKGFTISINTTDYQSQTMYISIEAVDRNGNKAKSTLQLQRSEGPYMELTPTNFYLPTAPIVIEGKLANSSDQRNKYDELASLTLRIIQLGIDSTLDIANGREVGGFIRKDLPSPRKTGSYIRYDVNKSEFRCYILLWENEKSIPFLTPYISVKDKNDNPADVTITLNKVNNLNPQINTDLATGREYFFSALTNGGAEKKFYGPLTSNLPEYHEEVISLKGFASAMASGGRISELKLQFTNQRGTSEVDLPVNPNGQHSVFDHTIQVGSNRLELGAGDTTITLIAKDNAAPARTRETVWLIKEDSTPPVFGGFSISTSTRSRYVKENDTVTLNFRVEDDETGVDFSTLEGSIAGVTLSGANFTYDRNTGSCSAAVALASPTQTTGDLAIDISVKDKIGNKSSINQGHFAESSSNPTRIQFLHGAPTLRTVSIASSNAAGGATVARSGDTVTLTVVSNHVLSSSTFRATIAGRRASVRSGGLSTTLTATAVIPAAYTNSPIPFEITAFSNAAGAPGNTSPPINSTTDGSSVILYAEGPTLRIGGMQVNGNLRDNAYIKTGDSFSFTVGSDQPLNQAASPTVVITPANTAAATFASDARSFTVNVASFAGRSDSRIAVTISGIENVAGLSQVTPISAMTINAWYYPGAPELTAISIRLKKAAGNTGNEPEIGDEVVLRFMVENSRVLSSDPTVALRAGGKVLNITKDGSTGAPNYRYTHTVVADDLGGNTEAPVDYTITGITDAAGNDAASPYTGSSSSFKLRPIP